MVKANFLIGRICKKMKSESYLEREMIDSFDFLEKVRTNEYFFDCLCLV